MHLDTTIETKSEPETTPPCKKPRMASKVADMLKETPPPVVGPQTAPLCESNNLSLRYCESDINIEHRIQESRK